MECPDPKCDGQLLITQLRTSRIWDDGTVPDPPDDQPFDEDYIICPECGETPSYSWEPGEGRINLLGRQPPRTPGGPTYEEYSSQEGRD